MTRAVIRQLPNHLVNQIAAGEVVERPASVVKELVENAIDAGATSITIKATDGGKASLLVQDNGHGMSADDLLLAVQRHATSKLPTEDLVSINTLGFRGEALPSIGSISKLTITSRQQADDHASCLTVFGGELGTVKPAAGGQGTTIEVRDLFYATPARLKFLKSAQAEIGRINDVINQLAMAHPAVAFSVSHNGKQGLQYAAATQKQRLHQIMGKDFAENAVTVNAQRGEGGEGVEVTGLIGVPTLNRATATMQFLFVNGRPVKDKLLNAVVRVAYQDFLSRDRNPYVALFLAISPGLVDVNVHPAKTEVRFAESAMIRGLLITALRNALAEAGHQASTTVAAQTLSAFQPGGTVSGQQPSTPPPYQYRGGGGGPSYNAYQPSKAAVAGGNLFSGAAINANQQPLQEGNFALADAPSHTIPDTSFAAAPAAPMKEEFVEYPLGAAVAQVHKTYVIAQASDGLVVVDQHAAHERLVYENMKLAMADGEVRTQPLLSPEVVDLTPSLVEALTSQQQELASLGLVLEAFGPAAIMVQEIPVLLGNKVDVQGLVRDLADEIVEHGGELSLSNRLQEIAGNMACRSSIRAGRELKPAEMNALLRQMEATPHSGQCNHGRPTYVKLQLADIERLFGRR